jgi:hypothetical protein
MLKCTALLLIVLIPSLAIGEIVKIPVNYRQGTTHLEGLLVYDNSIQTPRPGVLVFPEWWGLNDYPKHRAEQLAQLGYVALAADMYGDDRVTDSPADATRWSSVRPGGQGRNRSHHLRRGDRQDPRQKAISPPRSRKKPPRKGSRRKAGAEAEPFTQAEDADLHRRGAAQAVGRIHPPAFHAAGRRPADSCALQILEEQQRPACSRPSSAASPMKSKAAAPSPMPWPNTPRPSTSSTST